MKKGQKTNGIPQWIIKRFVSFHWGNWAIYCITLFIVGQIINFFTNYRFSNFTLHQVLLISATTMLVYAMKSFFKGVKRFEKDSTDYLLKRNPEISGLFNERYLPLQRSFWPFLASIIVTTFFFTCIVLLEYIKVDIIGIYAIFIAGSSVLFGVYSYTQYLFFLWFIYKAGQCEVIEYDSYAPADTKWITIMAKISQILRNYFLFIGLIYVIEYAILVPANKITITTTISINMPNNLAFILSWIAVFLLVIVAFPIINRVQFELITKIISLLKGRSIKNLSELMFSEKGPLGFTNIIAYNVLIDAIRKSKDYPLKRQLSYETLMLMVTFVVHIFNLYSKISSLPFLSLPNP